MSLFMSKFNEWESTHQLTDDEKESISLLAGICSDIQIIQTNDNVIQEPKEEIHKQVQPDQVIVETTQQFLSWFTALEKEMEEGQEDIFQSYLDFVNENKLRIKEVIVKIQSLTKLLEDLQGNYDFVQSKTKGLQNACENLLEEQAHLMSVNEDISNKLAYFNELDSILQLLNTPGETIVVEAGFSTMLQKVDQCLAFVTDHPEYKDSPLFKMRYRQCMTRGLTLIKLYFVESIRQLQSEIRDKIKARESGSVLPSSLQLSLFYVKFKSFAAKTKPLISEIEQRCVYHREYLSLLRDCFAAYTSVRSSILSPYIHQNIRDMSVDTNLTTFASKGCAYIIRLCTDEYQLFCEFFSLGEEEVKDYLYNISILLSHQLRPLILKETRIDVLSELCQSFLFHLKSTDQSNEVENGRSHMVKYVVESILQETQERLTFRAQDYIRTEIEAFRPREQEILVLARGPGLPKPAAINSITGVSDVLANDTNLSPVTPGSSSLSPTVEAALESAEIGEVGIEKPTFGGGEWYPTLQRTMKLLQKLHGSVPEASFDDLAQDVVESCRSSIIAASILLAQNQTPADGQLFIIKNLLQLREHISFYDSKFTRSTRTFDVTEVFDALKDVFINPLTFQTYGNLALPFLKTQEDDVRQILDNDLKKACESFILDASKTSSLPITQFVLKAKPYLSSKTSLVEQPFASTENIKVVYESFVKAVNANLLNAVWKLKHYLGDKNTQLTLIRIIRNNILSNYIEFMEIVKRVDITVIQDDKYVSSLLDQLFETGLQVSSPRS
ncbi:Sec34-like family-domain-containing protein [Globomyces pollinis-pini]|nr:Sec34-like family-domain-containing protein [Globomyces pollinis-pini]